MFKVSPFVRNFVSLLLVVTMLLGCATPMGSQPASVPSTTTGGGEGQQPVAVPKPEPQAWVISLPWDYSTLLAECGKSREVAATNFVPQMLPQDCVNMFSHGLRAMRLAEFAAAGISVVAVFSAIADGSAHIEKTATDSSGKVFSALVDYMGQKIILIFGAVKKPTTFPLPLVKIGETVAQAMERMFSSQGGRFPNPIPAEKLTQTLEALKSLAGCVSDLLRKHSVDTVPAGPIPEATDQPVPLPEGTQEVPNGTSSIVTNQSQTFATTDSELLQFSPEEIEILIFLGVVAIIGYVVISCVTTACTGTLVLVVFV